jgi:hypothetical protein
LRGLQGFTQLNYWVYTTILVAIYFAVPSSMSDRSGVSLIGSYLLWPTNGGTFLAVGWTLIHEMYFYLVVTAMLAIRAPAAWMLLAWGVVIALSPLVVNPNYQIEHLIFNSPPPIVEPAVLPYLKWQTKDSFLGTR